jgi:hypothetical protein
VTIRSKNLRGAKLVKKATIFSDGIKKTWETLEPVL